MYQPTEITLHDQVSQTYRLTPPSGVELDDVLKPECWAHITRNLIFGSKVEVFAADGTWYAEMIVRSVGKTEAVMGMLSHVKFGATVSPIVEDAQHEIRMRGPRKWSIIRKSDGAVIKEDIDTREQAEIALRNHMKALAA